MTVVGVIVAFVMARFDIQYLNAGPSRLADLLISLWNIACFTALFWLAVYWRRKPEMHRRLMLLATSMLMAPALARFPQPFVFDYFYYWVDAAILLGAARDLIVTRRIQMVYYCTLPVLIVGQLFVAHTVLTPSAWWMRIAGFLVR